MPVVLVTCGPTSAFDGTLGVARRLPRFLLCVERPTRRMSHRKRKYRQRSNTHNSQYDNPDSPSSLRVDPTLFIVAHEADIIRGPQAARAADSLEVGINVDGKGGSRIGDALIKWEGNGIGEESESGNMWVDRCVRPSCHRINTPCHLPVHELVGHNPAAAWSYIYTERTTRPS